MLLLSSPKESKGYATKLSLCPSPNPVVVYAAGKQVHVFDALIGMRNLHLKDAPCHRGPRGANL